MSGLTNEYDGFAYFLRGGEIVEVPAFADLEMLQFAEPVGRLEAFVTSGGLSTAPWTWKGTLERLENKTLKYPGHCARFTAYRDLGLLDQEPVTDWRLDAWCRAMSSMRCSSRASGPARTLSATCA